MFWFLITPSMVSLSGFFPAMPLAQTPQPQEIVRPQQVRPLPGALDAVPVFNSNSPELVKSEGILLSTFSPEGKSSPEAHLDFEFQGRFDLFAHHVAKADPPEDLRSLHVGVIAYNPSDAPVTIDVFQGASYLSQPDAPFIDLPSVVENPKGDVFAGPGSRAMSDVMRGRRQDILPESLTIPPGEMRMLLNLPIPVRPLEPPINGRSTLMRMRSDGPVRLASLALFAKPVAVTSAEGGEVGADAEAVERAPNLAEWRSLLESGSLSSPRDKVPTPIGEPGNVIYSRVAGVAEGSRWKTTLTDTADYHLSVPEAGQAFSYGLSTLYKGRMGTGQNQSAEMLRRYPDTAYQAHGNYGIEYDVSLPLINNTGETQTVAVALETAIKEDVLSKNGLRFFEPLPKQTFFRGTVRVRYVDELNLPRTRFVHLVHKRGQQGEPLVELKLEPGAHRLVRVDFLYPPDSTPPQVLTVRSE